MWLLPQSATSLWSRGQHQQALTLEEQTLTTYRRVLGENHPDTLTSMDNPQRPSGIWVTSKAPASFSSTLLPHGGGCCARTTPTPEPQRATSPKSVGNWRL